MTAVAALRPALTLLLAIGLAACDPLGEGNHPAGVRVTTAEGAAGPLEVLECSLLELTALAQWEGDDRYEANVNAVAEWESSDPAVVEVGDRISRAANFVVARAPGSARIRVEYEGFTAAMIITVRPVLEQRIVPATAHMAPGSTGDFSLEVRADPDDPWTPRTAEWSILQDGAAATVDAGGTVQALSGPEDVPFQLQARLPYCSVAVTHELQVSPVSHLALEYEQPPAQPLPLQISALIRVLAHFEDPALAPQDLSGQVEIDLENTDDGAATYTQDAEGIALQGLVEDRQAQLSIRYAPLGLTVLSDRYRLADLDQTALRLDPAQLVLQYPAEEQLQALGYFSDGIERIVTRHVDWTSSDATVASVTSGLFGAGELTVLQDVEQDLQIEAFTTLDGQTVSAEMEVRINRGS